jgi:transposase
LRASVLDAARITEKQLGRIEAVLRKKPEDVGLNGGIWDGKSLSAFIRKDFGIKMGIRQCQRLFSQLGFRMKKPRPMIARSNTEIQKMFKKKSGGY